MNGLHKLSLAATLTGVALFAGTTANAQMINGSFGVSFNVPSSDTGAFNSSTNVTFLNASTNGSVSGDYTVIPFGTVFGTNTLSLSNPVSFTLTNALYGSFAATSATVVQLSPNFYDTLLIGTFSPGPGLQPFDPTPTSLRISLTFTGNSVSGSGTLASPPQSLVPEPGSVAMLVGMGVSGGLLALRRRRK